MLVLAEVLLSVASLRSAVRFPSQKDLTTDATEITE